MAYRGAHRAEDLDLVEIDLETRIGSDRLITLENIIVDRHEKYFLPLHLQGRLFFDAVKGALLALIMRDHKPIECHLAHGYRNILSRFDGDHALELFRVHVGHIQYRHKT